MGLALSVAHQNALQMHGVVGADGEISMSSERPFVVTFDEAKSVSVKVRRVDDWEVIACCDLIPRFPDIPDEWTVTIESNLVKQRNTVYKTEFYSASRQKLRVDQEINRRRQISFVDLNTREIQQVLPNSTCISLNSSDVEYGTIEYGFLGPVSTLDFFRTLVGLQKFEYIPSKQNVRGVDVEEWRGKYQEPGGITTYNISLYFAADTWEVNDNMYRRDLKRIHVGDAGAFGNDPEGVEQYHEFFQMRPVIASDPDTVFDPCSVSSQVTGFRRRREAFGEGESLACSLGLPVPAKLVL
ncbi:hypothetical protein CBR_g31894 [Chara braunii]|uniref:Uncharacterized protein n=1 Tax=Chara braunii TaxID=69332 RepID=A0A388LGB0_CHABU|nr:hypothetical protein CBR_g31894 [Chara braunii]|eukprot:GBG81222.1 hypothetical protein CBR_g31894 [Chara braunii]